MDKYKINFSDTIPSNFFAVMDFGENIYHSEFLNLKSMDKSDIYVKFEIYEDEVKKLLFWDCLPMNKTDGILISKKMQYILCYLCEDCVEFIKPSLFTSYDNKKIELDYKILHILTDDDSKPIYRTKDGGIGMSQVLINTLKNNKTKGFVYSAIKT